MTMEQSINATTPLRFDHVGVRRILPHRASMLLLDRVEAYWPAQRKVIGVHGISQTEPLLAGYIPDHPFFPLSLTIEALAQTAGFMMNLEYLVERGFELEGLARGSYRDDLHIPHSVLADSKLQQRTNVFAGDVLYLNASIVMERGEMLVFRVLAEVDNRTVAEGEIMLAYPVYTGRAVVQQ